MGDGGVENGWIFSPRIEFFLDMLVNQPFFLQTPPHYPPSRRTYFWTVGSFINRTTRGVLSCLIRGDEVVDAEKAKKGRRNGFSCYAAGELTFSLHPPHWTFFGQCGFCTNRTMGGLVAYVIRGDEAAPQPKFPLTPPPYPLYFFRTMGSFMNRTTRGLVA